MVCVRICTVVFSKGVESHAWKPAVVEADGGVGGQGTHQVAEASGVAAECADEKVAICEDLELDEKFHTSLEPILHRKVIVVFLSVPEPVSLHPRPSDKTKRA